MNKCFLFLLFSLLLISCKKDRDAELPHVQIETPAALSTHHVLQAISFRVSASDERDLVSITVRLLDAEYKNAATPQTKNCSSDSEIFEGTITADDIHLPSGTYYIKAIAFDGYNEKVMYREIYLNEVPKILKKTVIVTYDGNQNILLDSLDGNTLIPFHSYTSDLSHFLIDSWNGLFVCAGSFNNDLSVQDAGYFSNVFSIANTGSGSNSFFTWVNQKESRFFIADRNEKIKSYRKSVQPIEVIDLGNNYAENFCVLNDKIIVASVQSTGSARSVQSYHLQSGVLQQGVAHLMEVKKMFSLSENEIILFGNESGTGKIKVYNIASNTITEPIIFGGGTIFDAEIYQGSDFVFLVASDNGLYFADISSLSINTVFSGNEYHHVSMDEIERRIYLSQANNLEVYDESFNSIFTVTANDSIAAIRFHYNK